MSSTLRAWLPALVMMIVIFTASSLPSQSIPNFGDWKTVVLKGGHATGYTLLGVAYLYGLTRTRPLNGKTWALAVLLALLYALTDEFHQTFTPGRTATLIDVGIDTAGAVVGTSGWVLLKTYPQRNADKHG